MVKSASALLVSGVLVLAAWWAYGQSNLPIAGQLTTLHQQSQAAAGYRVATFYTPATGGSAANYTPIGDPKWVRLAVESGCLVGYVAQSHSAASVVAKTTAPPRLVVVPLGSFLPQAQQLAAHQDSDLRIDQVGAVSLGYSLSWLERLTVSVAAECADQFPERMVLAPTGALPDRLAHWVKQPE